MLRRIQPLLPCIRRKEVYITTTFLLLVRKTSIARDITSRAYVPHLTKKSIKSTDLHYLLEGVFYYPMF